MFGSTLREDVSGLERLVYDIEEKVDSLYKRDHHDFLRPKVDLLHDKFNNFKEEYWNTISKLEEKIDELERKQLEMECKMDNLISVLNKLPS